MSKGGIPIQPYVVLGGFLPEGTTTIPKNASYERADSVVITIIVDNYDADKAEKSDYRSVSVLHNSFRSIRVLQRLSETLRFVIKNVLSYYTL